MAQPGRKPTVSDQEILQAVALSPDPIVTAPELADQFDMTRQGMNSRLKELVADEYLDRREVGSKAVVYWLTPEGRELISER